MEKKLSANMLVSAQCIDRQNKQFEFILTSDLEVITSYVLHEGLASEVPYSSIALQLFALQEVKVNPNVDNSDTINKFRQKLNIAGAEVNKEVCNNKSAINQNAISILDEVRFYLKEGKLVLLTPNKAKLKAV